MRALGLWHMGTPLYLGAGLYETILPSGPAIFDANDDPIGPKDPVQSNEYWEPFANRLTASMPSFTSATVKNAGIGYLASANEVQNGKPDTSKSDAPVFVDEVEYGKSVTVIKDMVKLASRAFLPDFSKGVIHVIPTEENPFIMPFDGWVCYQLYVGKGASNASYLVVDENVVGLLKYTWGEWYWSIRTMVPVAYGSRIRMQGSAELFQVFPCIGGA